MPARRLRYLTMTEAAKCVPGRRPNCSTLWRWARRGLRARNGERVLLRHIRVGARIYTTEDWLEEFFEELAATDVLSGSPAPHRADTVRRPPTNMVHSRDRGAANDV